MGTVFFLQYTLPSHTHNRLIKETNDMRSIVSHSRHSTERRHEHQRSANVANTCGRISTIFQAAAPRFFPLTGMVFSSHRPGYMFRRLLMESAAYEPAVETSAQTPLKTDAYPRISLGELLRSWEFYLVIIASVFLRLYQLNTSEFDNDEAALFQMAYNAVHHGYLVATSNMASLHFYDPPATVYLLMLPATFTADPLWGAIMTGALAAIAVVLTYLFVRRYYGRLAATIAALTYATAFRAIVYARFIWNQNFLPLFVILLFIVLFQGVVARKRGWLAPALLLLGFAIQFHASGIFLVIPLAVALVLAPGTVRKRDLVLGLGLLLLLYAPYLLWEFSTHLADIPVLFSSISHQTVNNGPVWSYYGVLLNPYSPLSAQSPLHWKIVPFLGEKSYLGNLSPYLGWISKGAVYLLVICIALLFIVAVRSKRQETPETSHAPWLHVKRYWLELRASPYRCGLLILLSWQIVPLVILIRPSFTLYLHYLIVLMPGPFILLGVGLCKVMAWIQERDMKMLTRNLFRYGIYALAGILIVAQGIGSLAGILDLERGHYSDGAVINGLYHDLRSLRNAVNKADQLAQGHHMSRVYISTDWPTQASLRFLSTQMHTPATLFNDQGCVVLPGAGMGPAVMLVGPYNTFTDALLRQFTSATLISQPTRPGGAPFRLYIVNIRPLATVVHTLLGNDLQLLNAPAQHFTFQKKHWLISQWELMRSAQASYRRVYGYAITQQHGGSNQPVATNQCDLTAMRAGDRVLIPLKLDNAAPVQHEKATPTISVQMGAFEIYPYYLKYGPLTFETYEDIITPTLPLKTANGQDQLAIPVRQMG
jgi:4-amino-4-deoxy-L-arabinose transferase-like glycosyltransferase